ncbi:MAG: hypothetical protein IAF94_03205 [Pirellulaceae bacterium]|nr:hypothetical protein [Pirellulaceae bacterium]
MDFVTVDVETANADLASICHVGIVEFKNGEVANAWEWLVNPDDYFNDVNVSIHGIRISRNLLAVASGVFHASDFPPRRDRGRGKDS